MNRLSVVLGLALLLSTSVAATAEAQSLGNRITFGDDGVVRHGERVDDLVTMGGDAIVDGEVLGSVATMGGDATIRGEVRGDVVTMGGDIELAPGAHVHGDLVTMGGSLEIAEGAQADGSRVMHGDGSPGGGVHITGADMFDFPILASPVDDLARWLLDALSSAVSFGLLFVLGLLLMGLSRDRLTALQYVIIREPLRAGAMGAMAFVGSIVAIVVLAITIIGIPLAVLLAMLVPFVAYVGLAASASVLGAALPIAAMKDRPVLQLAAGVGVLFLASLVPYAGTIALAVAAALGVGAIVRTKLSKNPPAIDPTPAGPYRTQAV